MVIRKPASIAIFLIFLFGILISVRPGSYFDLAYGADAGGTLSLSTFSIQRGRSITITIEAQDSIGLKEVTLKVYKGKEEVWEKSQKTSGSSARLVWRYLPLEPGLYSFCGSLTNQNREVVPIDCLSANVCENQCSYSGQKECYDNVHKRICGDYFKDDPCLEWSSLEKCQGDNPCGYKECESNQRPKWLCREAECIYDCFDDPSCGSICQDECLSGERQCFSETHIQTCQDYNNDGCLEWSDGELCQGNTSCGYGGCNDYQRPDWRCFNTKSANCRYNCLDDSSCQPTCQDECSLKGESQCLDNLYQKTCHYFYDTDPCLEWSSPKSCTGNTSCGYQTCRDNQRPSWYCLDGKCVYDCLDDESCLVSALSLPTTTFPEKITIEEPEENVSLELVRELLLRYLLLLLAEY